MSQTASSFARSPEDTPALLVGVTGLMDLRAEDIEPLKAQVRRVFRFLRHGANSPDCGCPNRTLVDALASDLAIEGASEDLCDAYREALEGWPKLVQTPIVVMSGLAPGADTLVVEVALEEEFRRQGFSVRAPLSFPHDLYQDATTFVRRHNGAPDPDNALRQQKYREILQAVGEENTFAVRLSDDPAGTVKKLAELEQRYRDDRDSHNRAARNRRYYAAGAYLATYCHLLIAVWDGQPDADDKPDDERSGTAAVADARLSGPRAKGLHGSPGLHLAAGGPLLHIFARRAQKTAEFVRIPATVVESVTAPAVAVAETATSQQVGDEAAGNPGSHEAGGTLPPLRFLHPYIFSREEANRGGLVGGRQHLDAELQAEYLAMFCRTAQNLEAFNAEAPAPPKGQQKEFEKRLSHEDGICDPPLIQSLETKAGKFFQSLRRVSDLRLAATHANRPCDEQVKRTLRWSFLLTLAAFIALDLFAEWRPRGDHGKSEAAAMRVGVSRVQRGAGLLALLLAVAALGHFAHQHCRQHAERGHDYRALAEGLRVQFYWNLAGLGRSVSANYMQRQRSELDWIRAAIRSLNFPYEQWSDYFARLGPELQIAALRCVEKSWIGDQFNYFSGKYQSLQETHLAWHALGKAVALAGLWSFAFCWLLESSVMELRPWLAYVALLMIVVASGGGWWRARKWYGGGERRNGPRWQTWVFTLIPGAERHLPTGHGYRQRLMGLMVRFSAYLPLSLIVAALAIGSSGLAADRLPGLPEASELRRILVPTLLLAGGLAVAWAEKNLFSELAYQYHTMAGLFAHARARLKRDLERLSAAQGKPEFDGILREIQDFLFALGREALDENAEWLLLHRARPLEPVMGG